MGGATVRPEEEIAVLIVDIGLAIALLVAIGLALSSCATARPAEKFSSSWTAERCQDLLDQRDALTWAAVFAGGLGGVAGVTTAIPEDSRRDVRLGLGISAAVLAAAATSMVALGKVKSSEFEIYCNSEPEELAGVADGGPP
jgi:hypothetical protein